MVAAAGKGCNVCGAPMIPPTPRRPFKLCHRWECAIESRRRAQLKAAATMRRRREGRDTKHCRACDRDKPLTREHWSPASYWPDGRVRHWATYCKPCCAAEQRDKYHTLPARRERHLRAAARQRKRGRGAVVDRGRRAREAQPYRPGRMSRLEAAPLVALVERIVADKGLPEADVCEVLGFTDRSLREWREGRRRLVQWDLADRAAINAGLRVEELWPES